MKSLFTIITLSLSVSSFAMVCSSEVDHGKKLQINIIHSNLVSASILNNKVKNVLSGELFVGLVKSTYSLYNQKGKLFKFVINHKIFSNAQHCRTRYCLPDSLGYLQKKSQGKLIIPGKVDEYFSCI